MIPIRQLSHVPGAIVLVLAASAFTVEAGPEKTATYEIQGAFCGACVPALTGVVEEIEGVHRVKVRSDDRLVRVVFDGAKVTAEAILQITNEETNFKLGLASVESAGPEEEVDSSDG